MSGGKNAQIAFYYQNLYTTLAILEFLPKNLIKAFVENKINGRKQSKEIDLILEFKDASKKFYEVKSGVEFTKKDKEIKNSILCLFSIFKKSNNPNYGYFLIINPDYKSPIAKRIFQIKTAKDYKKKKKELSELCEDWEIKDCDLFKEFCEGLDIEISLQLEGLKDRCIQKIREYAVDRRIFYTNYALTENDLLNMILSEIINSIQNNNGEIDLADIIGKFVDWCAKNDVAYNSTKKPDEKLSKAREKYLKEFQNKFSAIKPKLSITKLLDINPSDKPYENK